MNDKLSIQDLINILAEKHDMDKKDADVFVREFFLLIEQTLESDKYIKIKGLGTFKLIEVGSRESVNVNTGERFKIEGHSKISFTPDAALRDLINKPFAHFETVVLNENTVLVDATVEDNDDENGETESNAMVSEEDRIVSADPINNDEVELTVAEDILKEKVSVEQIEVHGITPIENPQEEKLLTEEIIARELEETEKGVYNAELIDSVTSTITKEGKEKREKDKAPVIYLVVIIVVVLLLCGGALAYVYYPEVFSLMSKNPKTDIEMTENAVPQSTPVDTVEKVKVDTVANTVKNTTVTNTSQAVLPVKPDSVNYIIVGTKTLYTIKEGETLTRVSLRFYGTKDLWPYIVKHNRDVIKNPDSVPYGITLKIPELTKK